MGTVIILIILGVLLLVAEIVVIPGIGVAGIAGGASLIIGIVIAYSEFGATTGHLTVLGAIVLCAIALYFSLRAKTWRRLALNKNIDSTANTKPQQKNIQIGDEGIAVTRLAPMGTVKINGVDVEARSLLEFIENGAKIVVVKFEDSNVIVTEKK